MKNTLLFIPLITINSFVQAAFLPLDDTALGIISGQAGITIESDLYLTVGSLAYKDEGSLIINDIEIGGANKNTYFGKDWGASSHSGFKLDGSLITVDVLEDGDLVISGSVNPKLGGGIIDFGISMGDIQLLSLDGSATSTFISAIDISGLVTKFRTKIDAQTSHVITQTEFGIDDFDIDISGLNIKVENAFIAAPSYFESLDEWGAQGLALQDITFEVSTDIHADDEGLRVDAGKLEFDMGVESIAIGPESIGAVTLDNVLIGQSSSLIYGHP